MAWGWGLRSGERPRSGVGVNFPPSAGLSLLPPLHGPGGQLGGCSQCPSEASFVREWMAQVLQTLQIRTCILFFSGCVCTLGPPVLPSLEEMDHSTLEPKESGTTVRLPPVHYCGNPVSDARQHHPQACACTVRAHREAASLPLASFPSEGRSLTSEWGATCLRLSALNLGL